MTGQQSTRLGRGLLALLDAKGAAEPTVRAPGAGLTSLSIGQIRPNPFQPRKEFRPEDLADLETSLRTSGLLQPISVRPAPGGTGYELIAGERRLRAAQRIGWTEIPAVVREVDDRTLLSLALVENLQRTDLNPIEEAEGYQRLVTDFALTQQEVADAVGKDRSTVANFLRLLALPASVRRLVWDGTISVGHARALLALGDEAQMAALAKEIVTEGLSVRDVERRARERAPSRSRTSVTRRSDNKSPEARRIEDQLRKRLQTDARVVASGGGRGELRLPFYSADDLERLLDLIVGPGRDTV
ncbi:MAG TPA: ParB/RepB/Spo0J family partition protein [Gemmatimonadaceae bacterium]|nr:ParB/RepB/Spo0J family partition protein [Gemmatimonadaceae bacterium]